MPWLRRRDRDPVAALGRVDLDVERLVVDPHAPVAAVGDRGEVADHVAARGSGSRSSSSPARRARSPRASRRRRAGGAGARPAARASRASRSAWRGDLLGVDGVLPRRGRGRWPRRRGRARAPAPGRGPRPRAARGRAAPWRSARAPRARCVFCSISSAAASRGVGSVSTRLLADEALELRLELVDPRRRAPPRAASRSSAAARSVQPERLELLGRVRLAPRAAPASISERPRSRRSISTSRSCCLQLVAPAQPQRDDREDRARCRRRCTPTSCSTDRISSRRAKVRATNVPPATSRPDHDERRAPARQRPPVGSGATSNGDLDLARQRCLQLADPSRRASRRRSTTCAEDRQRVGDGWLSARAVELGDDVDRLAVALVALLGGVALGGRAARPGAPSRARRRSARAASGLGAALAGARQRVAVALELGERQSRPARATRCAWATACLGDLEPAGVLVALRRQVVERPLELALGPARAAVGAADRGLEAVAEGAPRRGRGRPARGGGPTRSSGRSPRSGCPVSSARTWSARVGSVIDWPS